LNKEIVEWLLDVEWDILYSYSRRSVTSNAQSICRNSQFNTKDPYITATYSNQKGVQYEIYYPFPSIHGEFSKAGLVQRNEFYHSALSQAGFNSSASESNV